MILPTVGGGAIENRIDKLVHSPLRIWFLNLSLAMKFVSVLLQTDETLFITQCPSSYNLCDFYQHIMLPSIHFLYWHSTGFLWLSENIISCIFFLKEFVFALNLRMRSDVPFIDEHSFIFWTKLNIGESDLFNTSFHAVKWMLPSCIV